MVYAIVFSLVLLNTDLHVANATTGTSNRRMGRDDYIKNTLTLVDQMAEKDAKDPEPRFIQSLDEKKWKKSVQVLLKNLYTKVKEHQIDIPVPQMVTQIQSTSTHSLQSDNNRTTKSSLINLDQDKRTRGSSGPMKHSSASEAQSHKQRIIFKSTMNRKHLSDKDGVKAKSRKWVKMNCVFQMKDTRLEIVMHKAGSSEEVDEDDIAEDSKVFYKSIIYDDKHFNDDSTFDFL